MGVAVDEMIEYQDRVAGITTLHLKCDVCKSKHQQVSGDTKKMCVAVLRSFSWSIGKRDICPCCRLGCATCHEYEFCTDPQKEEL